MTIGLFVALMAFGVVTGMLAGLLGVGGGIFMVPFLVLVLALSQQTAQATSLLVVLPTAIVATLSLRKRGAVDVRRGLRIGVAGVVGGIGGAFLALALPGETLRVIFALLLCGVGLKLLSDSLRSPRAET